jgi:hypothetical protein
LVFPNESREGATVHLRLDVRDEKVAKMHEDSKSESNMREGNTHVVLYSPERDAKVPWHDIKCMATECNLGLGGTVWRSPMLPGMTAMQLHMHLDHWIDVGLEEEFFKDPSLIYHDMIISSISGEDNFEGPQEESMDEKGCGVTEEGRRLPRSPPTTPPHSRCTRTPGWM